MNYEYWENESEVSPFVHMLGHVTLFIIIASIALWYYTENALFPNYALDLSGYVHPLLFSVTTFSLFIHGVMSLVRCWQWVTRKKLSRFKIEPVAVFIAAYVVSFMVLGSFWSTAFTFDQAVLFLSIMILHVLFGALLIRVWE